MNINNTNNVVTERSRLGYSRDLQLSRTDHVADPRNGGSRGVPLATRLEVLDFVMAYNVPAAARQFGYHETTIYRWMQRVIPYRMTGNKERVNLVGFDQFLLTLAIFFYPRASADSHCAFILANGGGQAYSRNDLYKRCKELGLVRKRVNLEAYQAFLPRNLLKCQIFFEEGPRHGIRGVRRWQLTDTDEAKFCLIQMEKKQGRALTCQRIRDVGHYTRGEASFTLIMTVEAGNPNLPPGVEGSVVNPRKWWRITRERLNQFTFSDYLDEVCTDIETDPVPEGYDATKYFMWDNLSVHTTARVNTMVELRERRNDYAFTIIRRPPYQPKYAPIEYIFGLIGAILSRKCARHWTSEILCNEIHNTCVMIGRSGVLNNIFRHCGY